MGPVVLLFLVGLLTVGFVWWAVAHSKKQREWLERLFAEVAERAGGRYAPGVHGLFKAEAPSITAHREGTTVLADTYLVTQGKRSTTYSRVTADYALGSGPPMHIRREGALHSIGKALGMQDLQTGDPAFDEHFMIKAPSAATVLRVLPRDERIALIHQLPGWWIRSTATAVTMERVGYPESARELEIAMDVATTIATADRRILATAAAHPDARAEGHSVVFAGTVEGRFHIGELGCELRVASQQGGPAIALDAAAEDAPELLPEGALEPALAAQVRRIGQARLARDDRHAWVTWRQTPDADAIDAAWRVLVGLAAPSTRVGAFR